MGPRQYWLILTEVFSPEQPAGRFVVRGETRRNRLEGSIVSWFLPLTLISMFSVRLFCLPSSPPQTPSDWLMKYPAVRRRAGKGCLGDGEEEDGEEEEEEEDG